MRIAVLGAGNVGRSLGAGLARAGHDVVHGTRDGGPRPGVDLPVATAAEAVLGSEVVVNGLPGESTAAVLRGLGAGALDGKVLLDPTTAMTERFTLLHPDTSLAEELQAEFPSLRVVKTLNTTSAHVMSHPEALAGPMSVFLSGDDAAAKTTVAGLLVDLGWPVATHVDLGGVSTARGTEHYFFLFMGLYGALGTDDFGIVVVGPAPEGAR